MSAGASAAIRAVELSVRYERGAEAAVRGATFTLARGAGLVVVGGPGSGKTTLLRGLLGLSACDGDVDVLGSFPGDPRVHRRIGYAPERWPYARGLSAADVAALVLSLRGQGGQAAAVDGLLDRVALADRDREAVTLEAEDSRRLSFACALVGNPDLLVLDDPWEFPEVVTEIRAALRRGASVLATAPEPGGLVDLLGARIDLASGVA